MNSQGDKYPLFKFIIIGESGKTKLLKINCIKVLENHAYFLDIRRMNS